MLLFVVVCGRSGVFPISLGRRGNKLSTADELRIERDPVLRHQRPLQTGHTPPGLWRGISLVPLEKQTTADSRRERDVQRHRVDETDAELGHVEDQRRRRY